MRASVLVPLLLSLACGRADEAARLVERLQSEPGLEPPALEAGTPVVSVEFAVSGTTVVFPREPVPQPGARLRLERAIQKRRTAPPTLWVVTVSSDGSRIRYWSAASDQARIRVTIRGEDGERGGRHRAEGALSSVRVPFEPGGELRVYRASGALLGTYRFGSDSGAVQVDTATTCPQVFRVHGASSDLERAVDILVLPEGFREEDLPLFRCATAEIFSRLAARPPFDEVASYVNVYRIDLASTDEGVRVPDRCPHDASHTYEPFSRSPEVPRFLADCAGHPLGEPLLPDGSFCERCEDRWKDLGFFHDPQVSSDCRVIWTHAKGLRHIWKLTSCVPDVDLVIVLANSQTNAGSGTGDSHPPVSVVALSNLADLSDPDDPSGRIEVAVNLVAHELGHALGLLDEYSGKTGELPEYQAGRNVVRRTTDGTLEPIPWAPQCVDPDGKHECMVFSTSPCFGRDADAGLAPTVGLVEGAFYETCGYYRASPGCILYELTSDAYCAGCTTYLEGLFSDLGMTKEGSSR